ncbi:MAG: WYL domain-containing protein [Pseudomonadota bacterium]
MSDAALKWGVEQRMEFIEFRLFWEGGVNRSDIIERFGVSVPQASKDLTQYQELAPENARYDKSARRYVAADGFTPVFLRPDPDTYLVQLRQLAEGLLAKGESWLMTPPEAEVALTPRRAVDGAVLRAVLAALRAGCSIQVRYQSMNAARPDPVWRTISPHAFGHDSFRWHVRAWCHDSQRFKDYLLPRMLDVGPQGAVGRTGAQDLMWHEVHDLTIIPHPGLSAAQQAVVARDFGMTDGRAVLPVRKAMLFYVLRRLGLLEDARAKDPRIQHVVAEDPVGTAQAWQAVEG